METLLAIIFIIFGLLQIILFFKIWGMTDDIRAIKNKYLDQQHKELPQAVNPVIQSQYIDKEIPVISKFSIDDLVIEIKTGKQMRIKKINTDNVHTQNDTYSCYVNGGAVHAGDFFESEIRLF